MQHPENEWVIAAHLKRTKESKGVARGTLAFFNNWIKNLLNILSQLEATGKRGPTYLICLWQATQCDTIFQKRKKTTTLKLWRKSSWDWLTFWNSAEGLIKLNIWKNNSFFFFPPLCLMFVAIKEQLFFSLNVLSIGLRSLINFWRNPYIHGTTRLLWLF